MNKTPLYFISLLVLILVKIPGLPAQNGPKVTLDQLQQMAREHHPLPIQGDLYRQLGEVNASQVQDQLKPQIAVTGRATYQSEVTSFDFPGGEGFDFKPKPDQYSVGVEIKQEIFDYGRAKTQKKIELQRGEVQGKQVEADYLQVKQQINQLFGLVAFQQENKKIMNLRINELDAERKKIKSAVTHGAALQSNFLVLESEYLATQERLEEINTNLLNALHALTDLTGQELDTSYQFMLPAETVSLQTENIRPEPQLFATQRNNMDLQEDMIHKNNIPTLYAFGDGYVGRPGYNFLNNHIRPYGMIGLGASWNISNYYSNQEQRSALALQKSLVDSRENLYALQLKRDLDNSREEITKLEKVIDLDHQIVEAKTAIRMAASSQLENGVITSSDYITELNAETQAQFNLKLHEIQLVMARESYNTTLGY